MGPRRSLLSKALLVLTVLLVVAIATHSLWMRALAAALIRDEAPERADIVVVLAGDQFGVRIGKAAELVKAGYAPTALVSGPPYFDMHECDAAIALMVHKGYPAQWFIPFPNNSTSTNDEAQLILAELRRRGVHRFLLVTSSYHTARATRVYRSTIRAAGGDFEFRTVAAQDPYFPLPEWWRTREGKKIFFIEWCKTIATELGV